MTFNTDLVDRFSEVHADILKALEALPHAALDWVPGREMNSMGVLVMHLAGAERYWLGVALGEAPARDRDAEFMSRGLTLEQVKEEVAKTDRYARQVMERLSPRALEEMKVSPRNNKSFSVGWCLLHALEHTVLHCGHIQLTRQLWDQRAIP